MINKQTKQVCSFICEEFVLISRYPGSFISCQMTPGPPMRQNTAKTKRRNETYLSLRFCSHPIAIAGSVLRVSFIFIFLQRILSCRLLTAAVRARGFPQYNDQSSPSAVTNFKRCTLLMV